MFQPVKLDVYQVFVKVADNPDGSANRIEYHTSNLLGLLKGVTTAYPHWRYANVYCILNGEQLASYTRLDMPSGAFVSKYEYKQYLEVYAPKKKKKRRYY